MTSQLSISTPRIRRTIARTAAALIAGTAAIGMTACSPSTGDSGENGKKPTDDISIVASTQIWADVADLVIEDDSIKIESIIKGNNIDPHGFEPSAADMAKAEKASLIVAGGGGYDSWLYSAVDQKKVIHALPLTEHDHSGHDHNHEGHDHAHGGAEEAHEGHDHAHGGAEEAHEGHDHAHGTKAAHEGHDHAHGGAEGADTNEHIWYDTTSLNEVANEIAKRVKEAKPDAKVNPAAVETKVNALDKRLHALGGADIAQTHPLGDHMVKHTELHDITPAGYRKTTLSEAEPAAADINEFLEAIEAGKIQVLLDSPQTETEYSKRIRAAAEAKKIPVVDVYETPEKGTNFFDMYDKTITALEKAAKSAGDHKH
ncbi:zinc ABC transporter substrate-binding protein [Staphylococcus chromogenes]|nr:zinc ABC transporter substrate-binding protein [Staphylococcus chromogenes]